MPETQRQNPIMTKMQVALGPQKEALLRFGFEASLEGAGVAQQALEAVEPSDPRSAQTPL